MSPFWKGNNQDYNFILKERKSKVCIQLSLESLYVRMGPFLSIHVHFWQGNVFQHIPLAYKIGSTAANKFEKKTCQNFATDQPRHKIAKSGLLG